MPVGGNFSGRFFVYWSTTVRGLVLYGNVKDSRNDRKASARPAWGPSSRSLDRVEDRLILVACLILAGGSVVGAIFDWSPVVYLPFIFLALYAILRILLPLRGLRETLRQTQVELAEMQDRLLDHECVDFRRYENNAELYGALAEVVSSEARNQIDTWYVRRVPPTAFVQKEAKRYFASVLNWAKSDPSRCVRRVICVNSPEMREWVPPPPRGDPPDRQLRGQDRRMGHQCRPAQHGHHRRADRLPGLLRRHGPGDQGDEHKRRRGGQVLHRLLQPALAGSHAADRLGEERGVRSATGR